MWGATGRCGFAFGCQGWRSGCNPCPHLGYYPAAWVDRASTEYRSKSEWLNRLTKIVVATPSEWLRRIAIERGFPEERVVYVPNPVDVSRYGPVPTDRARQQFGLNAGTRYALFVASDCDNPLKGYREFLAVVRHVGWRGLVAGGEPSELPPNVRYLGSFRDPEALS